MRLGLGVVVASATTTQASWLDMLLSPNPRIEQIGQHQAEVDLHIFEDTIQALQVMQDEYFQTWVGSWPETNDWTAAVMGSHVSGALRSLSEGLGLVRLRPDDDYRVKENLITLYFSHVVSFYFGQDAFSIRNEAYDDILWVVLGWLDAIQFINLHHTSHYKTGALNIDPHHKISAMLLKASWHGNSWIPAFSHRARIFWDLASAGWDTKLCGGGMNWNPRLKPYKNAITNELFIAASISMYLYFPGDQNPSPFQAGSGLPETSDWPVRNPRYLAAAIEGYKWLTTSGMRNHQGLYTDGFHISGPNNGTNEECDERNDMVYTYNQGVLLTGQLGLFQVTGIKEYLEDGHQLTRNVIKATGWDLKTQRPVDNLTDLKPGRLPPWHGLGRAGVLEDACDVKGDCSQDSQTFKGIYMHHLATFCAPLELVPGVEPETPTADERREMKLSHLLACTRYIPWLQHNAQAALGTRDSNGRFGMWWTAGLGGTVTQNLQINPDTVPHIANATDYRTFGVPHDAGWMSLDEEFLEPAIDLDPESSGQVWFEPTVPDQNVLRTAKRETSAEAEAGSDPNNRGRGRTVETQGGGLAVLRAFWEISRLGVLSDSF